MKLPFLLLLAWMGLGRAAPRPNIIVFLADDLGYGELGCYGQQQIHTPHLDRLAAEGIRFTQFYAGHAVCAPSRGAFLTGRHSGHGFVRENSEGGERQAAERTRIREADGHFAQLALPASEITIAESLHAVGYRTACIGKWGLGHPSNEGAPQRQGFDFFYGLISQWQAHNHFPAYLWRHATKEPLAGNDGHSLHGRHYAADRCEEEALAFLRQAKADQPFFLYYATPVPHVSLQVPADEPSLATYRQAFAGKDPPYDGKQGYLATPDPRATYAAMVTRLDRTLGRMRDLLQETGQSENTLIIFTSDNGASYVGGYDRAFFRGNHPLRGYKGQLWEGGIRVPCLAAWPGKIKPGQTSSWVGASWDLFPTLAELAGAAVPAALDGVSLASLLQGGPPPAARPPLYWETMAGGHQALRLGDWKGLRLGAATNPAAPLQLFNLADDPSETREVAALHPAIAAHIAALLKSSRVPSAEFPLGALDASP